MNNRIHFLSGLPRCGSSLLCAILNQNPQIDATPTSPLFNCLQNACDSFKVFDQQFTYDAPMVQANIYRSIVDAFHPRERDKPIVFNKHRSWPGFVSGVKALINSRPKIVCPIRPIASIIASYLKLIEQDPDNFVDRELGLLKKDVTNESRAQHIWEVSMRLPYENLAKGLREAQECLLLVEYDDLVFRPDETLRTIYEFCEIESFQHDFERIENPKPEMKDDGFGMKGLHDVRPKLGKTSISAGSMLPQSAIGYFAKFDLR